MHGATRPPAERADGGAGGRAATKEVDRRRLLGKGEVAEILGVRAEIVQDWLDADHLRGFRSGSEWTISPIAVDLLLERLATGETTWPAPPPTRRRAAAIRRADRGAPGDKPRMGC
jgi:hypothetical protein